MPKPTQAEVAALVGRLREWPPHVHPVDAAYAIEDAADALEALAGEGAEPVTWTELPPLPSPFTAAKLAGEDWDLFTDVQMRAYAMRALRERA